MFYSNYWIRSYQDLLRNFQKVISSKLKLMTFTYIEYLLQLTFHL